MSLVRHIGYDSGPAIANAQIECKVGGRSRRFADYGNNATFAF